MNIFARFFYFLGDLFASSPKSTSGSFDRLSANATGSSSSSEIRVPKGLNLDDAVRAYRRNSDHSRGEELANEIIGLAHTFDDWLCVAEGVSSDTDLWQRAVDSLASMAWTFDQNAKVRELSTRPDVQSAALEKMASLASDTEEKLRVYEAAGPDSVIGKAIFQEVTAGPKTCEEWMEILCHTDSGTPIGHLVATKAIETAATLEELADLACEEEIDGEALEQLVLEKMRGMTASFDDWQTIASNYEGEVEVVAREKMMESASTIDELLEIADEISGDDDLEAKLIEKATQSSVWTDEICRQVLDDHDSGNILFHVALKKLLETARSTEDHLKIYFGWEFDEDGLKIILDSLSATITASEKAVIALVGEEGSTLVEWAEKK